LTPKTREAFAAGELPIDQAALAVRARPEHDDDIAVWARVMTLPQLRIAVRASNNSADDRNNAAGHPDSKPRRCHRDHHLGRLDISGNADRPDGITFRDEQGWVIDTATHAHKPPGPPPHPVRPYRHPLGERLQRWAIVYNPSAVCC
jgi:hypothetical protein